ncbi:MAG TPA: N-6 DNA methylase [Pyrinomonadaceae bacterium]|nr:N-6 DNA methylase [Pyrinomonadaceae bacterium]
MLDNETRRRIDTARDILVGKLPDPKSQVEQITIALIYKFMDDMDAQSVEFGGEPSFFVGDYERFGWRKIFSPSIGGFEMLNLYGEAITSLNQNPNLPQLFRDVFKNAFLPYRDPETLKLFLKTINEFQYDHSERLGDAFEYLLSVLGSQGDAGQFRTPRHIIDFIVEVVQPKKNETVCDPACGTAGFLISSYKHILRANTRRTLGDLLTPDERKRLMTNFVGYDISPDMVRLSLVNLYLHGFPDPHIYEYDALTSEERWNESFDVVMANPPFMSPKGGIKPHKRFSLPANRSEVLFVDYIAEHINPVSGRAGVIVPEGIIFQSANAYRDLRKMLVEKAFLYAVVSLPAGVFQPYSGVKTSILFFDKALAAKSDKILFVKINNDGFGLGAQRKELKTSDLPDVLNIILEFQKAILSGDTSRFADGELPLQAVAVEKSRIAENGDFNLSRDRYQTGVTHHHSVGLIELGEICKFEYGFTETAKESGDARFIRITDINGKGTLKKDDPKFVQLTAEAQKYLLKKGDLLVARTGGTYGKTLFFEEDYPAVFASFLIRLHLDNSKILNKYYWAFTLSDHYLIQKEQLVSGGGQPQFNANALSRIKIPLPPLSVQKEIVERVEAYQRLIDGAKQVVQSFKPNIQINPDWQMVELSEVCEVTSSKRIFQNEYVDEGIPFYRTKEVVELSKGKDITLELFISEDRFKEIKEKFDVPQKGEILVSAVGTIGITWVIPDDRAFYFKDGNLLWIRNLKGISPAYLKLALDDSFSHKMHELIFGAAYNALTIVKLKAVKIPLPHLKNKSKSSPKSSASNRWSTPTAN